MKTYLQKFKLRLVKDGRMEVPNTTIGSSLDVVKYMARHFEDIPNEQFCLLTLDARNKITGLFVVSEGSITAAIVHPREVFIRALYANAVSVIFAHNHPSGDPTPSNDDIQITKQLVDAGRLLDIRVLDHIIIGENGSCTSFASRGMII